MTDTFLVSGQEQTQEEGKTGKETAHVNLLLREL
jgi:hypothetical protein